MVGIPVGRRRRRDRGSLVVSFCAKQSDAVKQGAADPRPSDGAGFVVSKVHVGIGWGGQRREPLEDGALKLGQGVLDLDQGAKVGTGHVEAESGHASPVGVHLVDVILKVLHDAGEDVPAAWICQQQVSRASEETVQESRDRFSEGIVGHVGRDLTDGWHGGPQLVNLQEVQNDPIVAAVGVQVDEVLGLGADEFEVQAVSQHPLIGRGAAALDKLDDGLEGLVVQTQRGVQLGCHGHVLNVRLGHGRLIPHHAPGFDDRHVFTGQRVACAHHETGTVLVGTVWVLQFLLDGRRPQDLGL
ncbi:hypothetical protein [Cyprinid herpesvirus 2]|nr:hypothetical protein [Cyprinid herpesvirus 2]